MLRLIEQPAVGLINCFIIIIWSYYVSLLFAVISRHLGRIIYLKYEPEGNITRTLGVVGKGITYDTGGADIKINGLMAGMCRDKCGAASVAGFMHVMLHSFY